MKKLFYIARKIILAVFLLYTYNIIAKSFGLIIPINYITVTIVSLLDLPGIALLMIVLKLFY